MARDYSARGQRPVQSAPTILTNPASTSTNQWFGSTRITSAAGNTWFIAAPLVQANGYVHFNIAAASVPGSQVIPPFYVLSVVPGSGFTIGFPYSNAAIVNTFTVNWKVDVRS